MREFAAPRGVEMRAAGGVARWLDSMRTPSVVGSPLGKQCASAHAISSHWPDVLELSEGFMFEQAFKNIDVVLWKDAGCTSELDYTEQSSWLLFLKYLDTLEANKAIEAQLAGKPYEHILAKQYRWESWASMALLASRVSRYFRNRSQDDCSV